MDASILQRYETVRAGNANDLSTSEAWAVEKAPVDEQNDQLLRIARKTISLQAVSDAAKERAAVMRLAR